ncbi:MAG TPA: PqqD family protein [Bacteroidia bacterium]
MNIKKNIALSDTGFVFNPSSGDSFSTNPIGMEIIKMLKDGKTDAEIKSHVLKTYMTDEATFEKDFYDFINMLVKINLIEADEKKEN